MMTIAHALIVAEARSCLAALAETAPTFDQSVFYERLLPPGAGRDELQRRAETAIEQLVEFGIDALSVELLLADPEDVSMLG